MTILNISAFLQTACNILTMFSRNSRTAQKNYIRCVQCMGTEQSFQYEALSSIANFLKAIYI